MFEVLYENEEIIKVNLSIVVEIRSIVPSRCVDIGAKGIDRAEEVVEIEAAEAKTVEFLAGIER